MNRRLLWLSLAVFLAALALLLLLPQALSRNLAGLQALEVCLTGNEVSSGPAAQNLQPGFPFFAAGLARCQGNEQAALQSYTQAFADPHTPVDAVRGAFPTDLDLARQAVAARPDDPASFFWLADILRSSDPAAAIPVYEQALTLAPREALAWDRLGHLYEDAQRLEDALHAYSQACRYLDQGKNGCLNAGGVAMRLERYAEAADFYRQALRQLPNYPPAQAGYTAALEALQGP